MEAKEIYRTTVMEPLNCNKYPIKRWNFTIFSFYKPAHQQLIIGINLLRKLLRLDSYNAVHPIEMLSVIKYSTSEKNKPIKMFTANKSNKIVDQSHQLTVETKQKFGSSLAEKSLAAVTAANSFLNLPKFKQIPSAHIKRTQIYFELLHKQWQWCASRFIAQKDKWEIDSLSNGWRQMRNNWTNSNSNLHFEFITLNQFAF